MKTLELDIEANINELDLSKIKFKLLHCGDKDIWTDKLCEIAISEYKRFLMLLLKYPDKKIIPNKLMDSIWHQHILDTRKYANDCTSIFGHFVHHNPYYGLTSLEEFDIFQRDFKETMLLYEKTFGESMKNLNFGLCDNDGSNCVSTGNDE